MTTREVQLRCFGLEMKKANHHDGLSELEQQKLQRYNALLYPDRRNLSAEAWVFWQRVRKCAGREKREAFVLSRQTQIAEMFP